MKSALVSQSSQNNSDVSTDDQSASSASEDAPAPTNNISGQEPDRLPVKASVPFRRPGLDRRLTRVQRDVLKMGALVENSCLLAREALCNRDLDAAKKIPVQDKEIDSLYRQIEVDCTTLLTSRKS